MPSCDVNSEQSPVEVGSRQPGGVAGVCLSGGVRFAATLRLPDGGVGRGHGHGKEKLGHHHQQLRPVEHPGSSARPTYWSDASNMWGKIKGYLDSCTLVSWIGVTVGTNCVRCLLKCKDRILNTFKDAARTK